MKHINSFENFINEGTIDKYIAKDTINGKKVQLVVLKNELVSSKIDSLINKLNKAGWRLGSGHDDKKLTQSDTHFEYTLELEPFVGAPTQRIVFSLVK